MKEAFIAVAKASQKLSVAALHTCPFRNVSLGTRVRNLLTGAEWGVMKEAFIAVANVSQKLDVATVHTY